MPRETSTVTVDPHRPSSLTSDRYRPEVVLKDGDSGPWCVRLVDADGQPATGWHDVALDTDHAGRPRRVHIAPDGVSAVVRFSEASGATFSTVSTTRYTNPLPAWVAPSVLEVLRARHDRRHV